MILDPFLYHDAGRNEALLRRGPKGRCACGEERDAAMTRKGRCYACDRRARGLDDSERHHLFGRLIPEVWRAALPSNPEIVVRLPVNEARCLDELRGARHPLLRSLTGDPLVDDAAVTMLIVEILEMRIAAVEKPGPGSAWAAAWGPLPGGGPAPLPAGEEGARPAGSSRRRRAAFAAQCLAEDLRRRAQTRLETSGRLGAGGLTRE
jgi:hypothetical protein